MTIRVPNELPRRLAASTDRLRRLRALHAPDIIVRNEYRVMQETMRALIEVDAAGPAADGTPCNLACAA